MGNKSGRNTLLWSVIMSAPGPIVVGLGLLIGKSSTQLADFIRRSVELLAIVLSFVVYIVTTKNGNVDQAFKNKLEKINSIVVSAIMVVCGVMMICIAIFLPREEKGNVIPGLAIALLGVVANCIFWIRYSRIGRETSNKILLIQSKLYRAKTFVDCSVTVALGVVLLSSNPKVEFYFDLVGTCIVSLYLAYTGISSFVKAIGNNRADK